MAQSRTAVNAKGGAGDPMQELVPTSLVPGQSRNDLGGPTEKNEKATDNSTKIDYLKVAPGKSNTAANSGANDGGAEGQAAPGAGQIGGDVIPGNANYDGTKKRSEQSQTDGGEPAPGKGTIGTEVIPGGGAGKSNAAEHAEIDTAAEGALDE